MPCVVDVVGPQGGRVTFIWSFGSFRAKWKAETELALTAALQSAAPRVPDLFLVQAGAWYPDRTHRFGVRRPEDMAEESRSFLESSLGLLRSATNATACAWLGLYGSNITHANPRMSARHAQKLPSRNALMRAHAEASGCRYIDAQAVCSANLAEDGLSPASTARLNGSCAAASSVSERVPVPVPVPVGKRCCKSEVCADQNGCRPYGRESCFAHGCGAWHAYGDTLLRIVQSVVGSECGLRGVVDGTARPSSRSKLARESSTRLRDGLVLANWSKDRSLCTLHLRGPA